MFVALYKLIWTIIHCLVNIYDLFHWLGFFIHSKCLEKFFVNKTAIEQEIGSTRNGLTEDAKALLNNIRVPQHVTIILGAERPNFPVLVDLVFWAMTAGVNFISFYDHKGVLKSNHLQLYKGVERRKQSNEKIVWCTDPRQSSSIQQTDVNGYKTKIHVSFLDSANNGQMSLVNCSRRIADNVKKHQHHHINSDNGGDLIDTHYVNSLMQENLGRLPEPVLALYFGQICCTYGLLPWHIRLTEFISLGSQEHMTYRSFVAALGVYSSIEQRFGK